jgi:hypothetical protein
VPLHRSAETDWGLPIEQAAPVNQVADWICCDTCAEWFTCSAVGITLEAATKMDAWHCLGCQGGALPGPNAQSGVTQELALT